MKKGFQLRKLRWIRVYAVFVLIAALVGADNLDALNKAFPMVMRSISSLVIAGVYFPFCELLNYY